MNDSNQNNHHDNELEDNDAKKGRNEIQKSINQFFENTKNKFWDTLDDITRMIKGQ